jgi:hypothetical protein
MFTCVDGSTKLAKSYTLCWRAKHCFGLNWNKPNRLYVQSRASNSNNVVNNDENLFSQVEQMRRTAQKWVVLHSQSIDAPHERPLAIVLGPESPDEKGYI